MVVNNVIIRLFRFGGRFANGHPTFIRPRGGLRHSGLPTKRHPFSIKAVLSFALWGCASFHVFFFRLLSLFNSQRWSENITQCYIRQQLFSNYFYEGTPE
jgi:hypothetical protein